MQSTKCILIVAAHWAPSGGAVCHSYHNKTTGVAVSARRIAENLAKKGVKVTVFAYSLVQQLAEPILESNENMEILRFGPKIVHKNSDSPKSEQAARRRQILDAMEVEARKRTVVGIFSLFISDAGLIGTYLSSILNVPLVLGARGIDVTDHIFDFQRLGSMKLIIEKAAAVVCVNEQIRHRLLTAFPEIKHKTSIIQNGTEIGNISQSRDEMRMTILNITEWPSTSLLAAFIGVPREKKGTAYLLNAMLTFPNDHPLKLLCLGPEPSPIDVDAWGNSWNKLKERRQLYCSGIKPRDEILHLALGADIVVMPSIEDGLANGLLEGMALGLCPIASDNFSDVLTHLKSGLIVPRGDVAALATALDCVVNNATLRLQMAKEAKRLITNHHSPGREAEDYIQCFRSAGISI